MKEFHYVFTVLMFCFFLLGLFMYFDYRMEELEQKIQCYDVTCKELIKEIQTQQEIERRILEQNILLNTELRLKGD